MWSNGLQSAAAMARDAAAVAALNKSMPQRAESAEYGVITRVRLSAN